MIFCISISARAKNGVGGAEDAATTGPRSRLQKSAGVQTPRRHASARDWSENGQGGGKLGHSGCWSGRGQQQGAEEKGSPGASLPPPGRPVGR